MALELVHLCDVEVTLQDPITVGDGPSGLRLVYQVEQATVTGERLSGRMVGQANADWLLVNGTVATLDVRATIETGDGAIVLAQYLGRGDLSEGPGVKPLYVAPRFETGDERYGWLNVVQAVGKGDLDGLTLRYEWYEVR